MPSPPLHPAPHTLWPLFFLVLALALPACGEDEAAKSTTYQDTPLKMRPPVVMPPGVVIVEGQDMGGEVDAARAMPDIGSEGDLGDQGVPDAGERGDLGLLTPDMSQDMTTCPAPAPCTPGQRECVGTGQLRQCERNAQGCAFWGLATDCPSTQQCTGAGQCMVVSTCVDMDNDGRGLGCSAGADCDDTDPQRYAGLAEVCDGKDNNCDNLIDNGIPGVGASCTQGVGACVAMGSQVCDAGGNLMCNALPGQPGTEMCDGIDNDCNGLIDDGNACSVTPACGQDTQEPNNSLIAPFAMTTGRHYVGQTCAGDREFFSLPAVVGKEYRINVAFPHSLSNLDLHFYENGVDVFSTVSTSDHEAIIMTAQANTTYAAEVRNTGMMPTYYLITLTDDIPCPAEDVFGANQSINTAAPFPRFWTAPVYMCKNVVDWFYLGDVDTGKTIKVDAFFTTGFFSGDDDIDFHIYGDPDGDNTYSVMASGTSSGNNESRAYLTTHKGPFYLKVFHKIPGNDGSPYRLRVEY